LKSINSNKSTDRFFVDIIRNNFELSNEPQDSHIQKCNKITEIKDKISKKIQNDNLNASNITNDHNNNKSNISTTKSIKSSADNFY